MIVACDFCGYIMLLPKDVLATYAFRDGLIVVRIQCAVCEKITDLVMPELSSAVRSIC